MPQVPGARRDTGRADPYILQRTFWRPSHCGDHTASSGTGPSHKCEPASPLLCLATVADDPQRVERSEGKRPPSGSCKFCSSSHPRPRRACRVVEIVEVYVQERELPRMARDLAGMK